LEESLRPFALVQDDDLICKNVADSDIDHGLIRVPRYEQPNVRKQILVEPAYTTLHPAIRGKSGYSIRIRVEEELPLPWIKAYPQSSKSSPKSC
jgi:hypothetical protein